jgi:hypothetical protein
MHARRLGIALSAALALALCCGPVARAQSGRARQLLRTEARASGLSGREVKARAAGVLQDSDETQPAGELSRAGDGRFDVRRINEGRRAPVAHSLDPEYITYGVIFGMIIVILLAGKT